jgi:hypothetical protein
VHGRSVADHLPRGEGAAAWLSLSNELQMLLHTHPVNVERIARGLPAINSVWISGGGALPPRPKRQAFSGVYSDDPLLRGLGLWGGSATAAVPDNARALLADARAGERLLLVLKGCQEAADDAELGRWNDALTRYERDWFEPLLRALVTRGLRSLELVPLNGYRYRLASHDLWRFWRRCVSYRKSMVG